MAAKVEPVVDMADIDEEVDGVEAEDAMDDADDTDVSLILLFLFSIIRNELILAALDDSECCDCDSRFLLINAVAVVSLACFHSFRSA